MGSNLLERAVLTKVDQLITILIELSSPGQDNRSQVREQAIAKCKEIIPLVLQFLEGKTQYIEPMLQQLIREKLPQPIVLVSFGTVHEELNFILKKSINEFFNPPQDQELPEPIYPQKTMELEPVEEREEVIAIDRKARVNKTEELSPLYRLVKEGLPYLKVVNNYKLRGSTIDAYLADKRVALVTETRPTALTKLNYQCSQEKIKLVKVKPELLTNSQKLIKYIKESIKG